jgi:hypothetical protein
MFGTNEELRSGNAVGKDSSLVGALVGMISDEFFVHDIEVSDAAVAQRSIESGLLQACKSMD